MDNLDVFKARKSVRKFKDKVISDSDIEQIIKAASLAPTARNVQPWEFVVVKGKDRLIKLAGLVSPNGAFIKEANACIVVFCKNTKYYLEDGCAATTQALLCAASLNLGSCWVAGDKKDYCEKVKDLFGVPEELKLISLIALGEPNESPNPSKRDVREMIHKERF
jgi:nitroreductase